MTLIKTLRLYLLGIGLGLFLPGHSAFAETVQNETMGNTLPVPPYLTGIWAVPSCHEAITIDMYSPHFSLSANEEGLFLSPAGKKAGTDESDFDYIINGKHVLAFKATGKQRIIVNSAPDKPIIEEEPRLWDYLDPVNNTKFVRCDPGSLSALSFMNGVNPEILSGLEYAYNSCRYSAPEKNDGCKAALFTMTDKNQNNTLDQEETSRFIKDVFLLGKILFSIESINKEQTDPIALNRRLFDIMDTDKSESLTHEEIEQKSGDFFRDPLNAPFKDHLVYIHQFISPEREDPANKASLPGDSSCDTTSQDISKILNGEDMNASQETGKKAANACEISPDTPGR